MRGARWCVGFLLGMAAMPGGRPVLAAETVAGRPVTVLEWNVYLGAALEPVMGAMMEDPEGLPAAVGEAWAQVLATDFRTRAAALADEIADGSPDLVALHEAAVWRLQAPADSLSENPKPARKVVYDFVKILRKELRAGGVSYRVAARVVNLDAEFPGAVGEGLTDVRYTDQDVILARAGVRTGHRQGGNFGTVLTLPWGEGFPIPRSWLSVDARVGKARVRFIAAHLEDGIEPIQQAQMAEILEGPAVADVPVILAGDFNSDADRDYSPAVVPMATGAGFTDAWVAANPLEPGLTWRDDPGLVDTGASLLFRLDHVFVGEGATVESAVRTGLDPVGGMWPSDHAGLLVTVTIP